MGCDCSATNAVMHACTIFWALTAGEARETGRACMTTAIIVLIGAICGVCGAGIAVAVAMVVWPESKFRRREKPFLHSDKRLFGRGGGASRNCCV
jgi:hypothetical protein